MYEPLLSESNVDPILVHPLYHNIDVLKIVELC